MIYTYVGPMFSGKTSRIVGKYNTIYNKDKVMCFKPCIDSRDDGVIKSRDYKDGIPAININCLEEIYDYLKDNTRTIFIDEAQFLVGSVDVLTDLSVNRDIDIYIAGLNMTDKQKPFGLMPDILAVSQSVEMVNGVCFECNKPALYTYYDGEKTGDVMVGNSNYSCLCGRCLSLKRSKKKL